MIQCHSTFINSFLTVLIVLLPERLRSCVQRSVADSCVVMTCYIVSASSAVAIHYVGAAGITFAIRVTDVRFSFETVAALIFRTST